MSHSSAARARLFRILRHPSRRHALAALAKAETTMTVRDVSNEVVAREFAARLPNVPADDVKQTYLSLLHVHIPMLEDAGIIEYDPNRKLIEETDLSDVRPLLSMTTEDHLASEPAR